MLYKFYKYVLRKKYGEILLDRWFDGECVRRGMWERIIIGNYIFYFRKLRFGKVIVKVE